MKRIVGVGHHKNVGKDTFTTFCIDVLRTETKKLNIKRRGFADKIYEFLHSTYEWAGFQPKTYYEQYPEKKNDLLLNGKTPRQMLIEVGTPVMRAYDNDVWINANLKNRDFDILFVTDLRFPNEFEAIKKEKGFCIRITRPNLPIPTDIADIALNGWDERWDFTFQNNDERAKLYDHAKWFVIHKLLEKK